MPHIETARAVVPEAIARRPSRPATALHAAIRRSGPSSPSASSANATSQLGQDLARSPGPATRSEPDTGRGGRTRLSRKMRSRMPRRWATPVASRPQPGERRRRARPARRPPGTSCPAGRPRWRRAHAGSSTSDRTICHGGVWNAHEDDLATVADGRQVRRLFRRVVRPGPQVGRDAEDQAVLRLARPEERTGRTKERADGYRSGRGAPRQDRRLPSAASTTRGHSSARRSSTGASAERDVVWARITAPMIKPPPAIWIGVRRSPKSSAAMTIV